MIYSLKHGEMELLRVYKDLNDKGKQYLLGMAREVIAELPFFKKGVDFYKYVEEEPKEQTAVSDKTYLRLMPPDEK